jgi:NO-binding membrane sensor protein with MHYT domain/putative methionine-R-sulfoxide reductase with GAF domain
MWEFLDQLIHSQHPDVILPHRHDPWLVTFSIVIAILASYVALDLAGRVTASRGRARLGWLALGAVAMGSGIWAMHFVAMLGFQVADLPTTYDLLLVIVSLLAAVVASGIAFTLTSRERARGWQLGLGALLMGAAIVGMHYIGMAAIRLPAIIHYETVPFAISVVIAVTASLAALWLQLRLRAATEWRGLLLKLAAAVAMGFAIAAMHYTGMWAAVFHPAPELPANPPGSIAISLLGGAAIGGIAVLLLSVVLLLSYLDQSLARLSYPQKFSLISLLFILPLAGFAPIVSDQLTRLNQYGYLELYGTLYLRPLYGLLQSVHAHERAVDEYLAGDLSVEALINAQAEVLARFRDLEAVDAQYGPQLATGDRVAQLRTYWEIVQTGPTRFDASESYAYHHQLAGDIRDLMTYVGDTSFLILDPDLDTFYLMHPVLIDVPDMESQLHEVRIIGLRVAARGSITIDDQFALLALSEQLRTNLEEIEAGLQTTYASDASGGQYRALVRQPERDHVTAVANFTRLINTELINTPVVALDPEAFAQASAAVTARQTSFFNTASRALESGVQARINRLTTELVGAAIFALLTAGAAFTIGLLLMRAISRPLTQLAEATQRLAAGDMSARVAYTGADEVGQVGLSFNSMTEQLRLSQEQLAARNRALATNLEVSRRLSTVLDPRQLVSEVVQQLQSAFGYYHAHIYLWDEERRNLVMAGGTGEAGRLLLARGHKLPRGRGLVGRAAESNQTVLVPDTAADPNWLPNPLLPETRAEVAVPIAIGDRVLGVLDVQQNRVGGLTTADAELVQSLANQVAIALQNAQSFERTRRLAERQKTLNAISRKIQSATSVEAVLETAARELGLALNAARARAELEVRGGRVAPPTNGEPHGNGHAEEKSA